MQFLRVALLAAGGLVGNAGEVCAQDVRPGFRISRVEVEAEVVEGIATVTIRLTLRSPGGGLTEAEWLMPVPATAIADDFGVRIGGQLLAGGVLAEQDANVIYRRIVDARQDPGLLEYHDAEHLRVRVFPVPARGTAEVTVRWRQQLAEIGGTHRLYIPLFGPQMPVPERAVVKIKVESTRVLQLVDEQPRLLHDLVARKRFLAKWFGAGEHLPPAVELTWAVAPHREPQAEVVTHSAADGERWVRLGVPSLPGGVDGRRPRSLVFVLDRSASMEGGPLADAKAVLAACLRQLTETDRFIVVLAGEQPRLIAPEWSAVTPPELTGMLAAVEAVEAHGACDLAGALSCAFDHAAHDQHGNSAVVLLSDGVPSCGIVEPRALLRRVHRDRRPDVPLLAFAAGAPPATRLLAELCRQNAGVVVAKDEGSPVRRAAQINAWLSMPPGDRVELTGAAAALVASEPAFGDWVAGRSSAVIGRWRGGDQAELRLHGEQAGESTEHRIQVSLARAPRSDALPSLWAASRIAALTDRLLWDGENAELHAEAQRLSVAYRLVTPFGAHLVVTAAELQSVRDLLERLVPPPYISSH